MEVVLLNGMIQDNNSIATLDITTSGFAYNPFYPHEIGAAPLVSGFISSNQITAFMSQFKLKIVSHIMPGLLRKEGYVVQSKAASTSEHEATVQPPRDNQQGLLDDLRRRALSFMSEPPPEDLLSAPYDVLGRDHYRYSLGHRDPDPPEPGLHFRFKLEFKRPPFWSRRH